MTPLPPSPFLNPAACDAAAGTAAAACTSPGCAAVGPSAADLWSRGEALLAEIYAYLAEAERTFDLDAERFMAELDEAPLFLRSA